jgi:hypothetical protein
VSSLAGPTALIFNAGLDAALWEPVPGAGTNRFGADLDRHPARHRDAAVRETPFVLSTLWRRKCEADIQAAARASARVGRRERYERHLAAHGRNHSAEEWRNFSDARLRAKYMRAKCC